MTELIRNDPILSFQQLLYITEEGMGVVTFPNSMQNIVETIIHDCPTSGLLYVCVHHYNIKIYD